jgi:hypothetical protein
MTRERDVIEADLVANVIWNSTQTTPEDLAGRSRNILPTLLKPRVIDRRLALPSRATSFGVSANVLIMHRSWPADRKAPDVNGAELHTSEGEG